MRTLADLEQAARDGRIREMKDMGAKKETLILEALEEHRRFAGRRLMGEAHDVAAELVAALRAHAPEAHISAVGSLRRGCETCGDIDILAGGGPASLMAAFTAGALVERCPQRHRAATAPLGRDHRPPGVAGARRRSQYAAGGSIQAGVEVRFRQGYGAMNPRVNDECR